MRDALFALLLMVPCALARADTGAEAPLSAAEVSRARELLSTWATAQNQGNFEGYRALYGRDFHGVRRSGDKQVELDLDGWMRERERMFRHRMTVSVDEASFTRVAGRVRVTFSQLFSSGSYADYGQKRLDLTSEAGRWLILGEELLTSRKTAPPSWGREKQDCPAAAAGALVGTFRGEPGWLVLGETAKEPERLMQRALDLEAAGVEAHPIATDLFTGLMPGFFVIVHGAYATREGADRALAPLRARGLKPYVRHSKERRISTGGAARLVEVRGFVKHNGAPERLDVHVAVPLGNGASEVDRALLRSDGKGRFVWWTDAAGPLQFWVHADPNERENSSQRDATCATLPTAAARVDLGTLDTTTWFCGS